MEGVYFQSLEFSHLVLSPTSFNFPKRSVVCCDSTTDPPTEGGAEPETLQHPS